MAFYVALCVAIVLYVYRFAVAGVNMSALRLLLIGWMAWLTLDVVRGRVRPERRYWPFLGVGAAMLVVNAIDFMTLGGYPALRRDIANHILNLALAGLIVVYVTTEARRHALLRAFVYSSLVTSGITLYSSLYDRLPMEWLIRTLGSAQAQSLSYISDDTLFERATAAFFDPNFYGIYSLLVIVAVMYLWLFDRPARLLVALFVLNLVCLSLTLSRTAVIGTLAAMAVTFLLSPRSRVFTAVASACVVALLYVATMVQSAEGWARIEEQVARGWEEWTTDDHEAGSGDQGLSAQGDSGQRPSAPRGQGPSRRPAELSETTSAVQARVVDGRSLAGRLSHIRQGLRVFSASPVWGQGSSALLAEHTQWSSAHVSFLTLLARYGVLGTAVYLFFLLWPLWVVWRQQAPPGDRYLVTVTLCTLMVVYLGYDILLFFEVQYLFFGLAYSIASHSGDASSRVVAA